MHRKGVAMTARVSVITTILILVFAEIIPKTIGATQWRHITHFAARTLRALIFVLYPTGIDILNTVETITYFVLMSNILGTNIHIPVTLKVFTTKKESFINPYFYKSSSEAS